MIFIFFLFRLEVPFLDLFGPKIKGKYVIKAKMFALTLMI